MHKILQAQALYVLKDGGNKGRRTKKKTDWHKGITTKIYFSLFAITKRIVLASRHHV